MDGLDVAEISFSRGIKWSFDILRSKTYTYHSSIHDLLSEASGEDNATQRKIDQLFGKWIGKQILDFGVEDSDLIAVHGHTVIHDPENGVSWQLGSGEAISQVTKKVVVTDFRTRDVQLGGQGAPLAPIGDFYLFDEYDGCLNLGGIANVSIREKRIAWDICPCNQVLNFFSKKLGLDFDRNGEQARTGKFDAEWEQKLKKNPFFQKPPPKSLPNQFLGEKILEEVDSTTGLRSYSEFIVNQIIKDVSPWLHKNDKILVTGGGAYNSYLIEKLNESNFEFLVPSPQLVEFKEAIIFGFLGVLKIRNETNVLASVTGSISDSSSGTIHYPK